MRRFLPALVLLLPLGCSGGLPPAADPAKGRDALKIVLDAWAKGGRPADLKATIAVSDPDWEGGQELLKYDLAAKDGRSGVDLQVDATLTLKTKEGHTVTKPARYVITTGSKTTVLRNDPDS